MRTRSDVGVRRRGNVRTPSDQRRIRRHRFSINGHYYNHKVQGLGERMGETWGYPDPFLGHSTSGSVISGNPNVVWPALRFFLRGRFGASCRCVGSGKGEGHLSNLPPGMGERTPTDILHFLAPVPAQAQGWLSLRWSDGMLTDPKSPRVGPRNKCLPGVCR